MKSMYDISVDFNYREILKSLCNSIFKIIWKEKTDKEATFNTGTQAWKELPG